MTLVGLEPRKYRDLDGTFIFYPIGLETFGGMGGGAKKFLGDLKVRLNHSSDDVRAGDYFFQRLSLILVRMNASCVMGTMISDDGYLVTEEPPMFSARL